MKHIPVRRNRSIRDAELLLDRVGMKFPEELHTQMFEVLAELDLATRISTVEESLGLKIDMNSPWLGLKDKPEWEAKQIAHRWKVAPWLGVNSIEAPVVEQITHGWRVAPNLKETVEPGVKLHGDLWGLHADVTIQSLCGPSITHSVISSGPSVNHCLLQTILLTVCKVYGF